MSLFPSADTYGLVLVAKGAFVPSWLTTPDFSNLTQHPDESVQSFGERACSYLETQPEIAYVVVALAVPFLQNFEGGLLSLGQKLIFSLSTRKKARLLLCVPAEITERNRKTLLALAGALAKPEGSQSSVIVGAHFSARPPPSGTLPLWDSSKTSKGCGSGSSKPH